MTGTTVKVPLSCTKAAACIVSLGLSTTENAKASKKKTVVIGKARATLKPGQKRTVTVKLNKAGKRKLKESRKLKAKLKVVLGGKTLTTRTVGFKAEEEALTYPSAMGRRSRRRKQEGGQEPVATSDYTADDGSVLTLRDQLSAGTVKKLADLDARPAADAEDRWQRRVEYLFERLAVRWEIAGLPLEGQKELLGRYRMASAEERSSVRQALDQHLAEHFPDIA